MGHLLRNLNEAIDVGCLGHLTGIHAQMGLTASLGQFVPIYESKAVLLCRELEPVGPWMIVGMADLDQATVENAASWPLEALGAYQFMAGRLYPNGQVGTFSEPIRVDVVAGGASVVDPPLPKWPINLRAKAAAGGAFTIGWRYDPFGQGAAPADFQVYRGATAATVDYGTPLTDAETALTHVVYREGKREYEMTTSDTWSEGVLSFFSVRARNSGGVAEKTDEVIGPFTARVTAPGAPAVVTAVQRRA